MRQYRATVRSILLSILVLLVILGVVMGALVLESRDAEAEARMELAVFLENDGPP